MTSRYQPPPIIKAAERLLVEIEQAVRQFPQRYHRYQIGADLRRQAMTVYRNANRAWSDRTRQREAVSQLVWDVDALKQHLQLAKLLHAFNSFRRFEMLMRLAVELGAQAGGWNRRLSTPNAQNAQANGVAQRGKKTEYLCHPCGGQPMTKPRYPHPGCAAWSQVYGEAAAWSSASAWNVNFNNGNVNNNHRNNNGFALACRRAGEFQGEIGLQELYQAWRRARRQKVPSFNQLRFDHRWADGLLQLQHELQAGTWQPRPSTCFIATRPKAREIHAPDFADRVVHHWLVPQLEAIWESTFIHDSYANRAGRGSHAAVRRAQQFIRQVHSGQRGGWYLQLDVANFFNSIHRPTLWRMLRKRMATRKVSTQVQRATHALLRRSPLHAGVQVRATPAELAQVPAHKRLANAPTGRGLPIGNLSSQFFANVYLDALDQFVKHELKAKRYLRYVDDFVLFHRDRAQLQDWQQRIETFLAERLGLRLKAEQKLRQLTDGLDFLGYVIHPTHMLARRRVVGHLQQALAEWEGQHVHGNQLRATPEELGILRHRLASFAGHLRHASSHRLLRRIHRRHPWLRTATIPRKFAARLEGRRINIRISTP